MFYDRLKLFGSCLLLLFFITPTILFAQSNSVKYTLNHEAGNPKVQISIEFESISSNDALLIVPRSGPGTYDLTNYQAFADHVVGYTDSGSSIEGIVGHGSFFIFPNSKHLSLSKVTYEVDIEKMESTLLGGFASSKMRDDYFGILGYSIFGFMDGLQDQPISLEINTASDWPIFSTLNPSANRAKGTTTYQVENYALLADAQYLLGNGVQVHHVENSPIPLFVAAYAETAISTEEIGRRGLVALKGLAEYFGYIPMPHYTLCYEFLEPYSDKHDYGFSMEHMNSMTSSQPVSRAILDYDPEANIGSTVHHIGHSWVPLRSYGVGYRPFEWQVAPMIETIWLNEGFTWYVSYLYVLKNESIIDFFENVVYKAPDYIKQKSLKELSRLGSTQYSLDFNLGRNLFSRGALLAKDLDDYIQKETEGTKSFKDVMLGLLNWTESNQRAFEYDEIPQIISSSVGVDIMEIWNKWQKPIER